MSAFPGVFYNPRKEIYEHINEKEAMYRYCEQLLTGDRADNIDGLYKVGPVKAKKYLAHGKDWTQLINIVMACWRCHFPDDWRSRLTKCGQLIHILGSENDKFVLPPWDPTLDNVPPELKKKAWSN